MSVRQSFILKNTFHVTFVPTNIACHFSTRVISPSYYSNLQMLSLHILSSHVIIISIKYAFIIISLFYSVLSHNTRASFLSPSVSVSSHITSHSVYIHIHSSSLSHPHSHFSSIHTHTTLTSKRDRRPIYRIHPSTSNLPKQ